jgi:DNA-binding Lrp family transcriptional regulator
MEYGILVGMNVDTGIRKSDMEWAKERVGGATLMEIAERAGVDESTVSRRLKREDVAEYMEELKLSLIDSSLGKAHDNVRYVVENYQRSTDWQIRDHGYKASMELLRAAGTLPSNAPTLVVNNNTFISPIVNEIIRDYSAPKDVLDITPEE